MIEVELNNLVYQIKDNIRSGEVGPNIICKQIDKLANIIMTLRQELDDANANLKSVIKLQEAIGIGLETVQGERDKLKKDFIEMQKLLKKTLNYLNLSDVRLTQPEKLIEDIYNVLKKETK
jgi:CRISPR/Cas system-associated endonuclease Cas3-HD